MTAAPASFHEKIAQFNRDAAKALYDGGVDAILAQMKLHAEIVANLRDVDRIINEALKRPDVIAAFRDPKRVVVSVRKEDDPQALKHGDYCLYDGDLESLLADRKLASLLAWFVRIAMGHDVVMEGDGEGE